MEVLRNLVPEIPFDPGDRLAPEVFNESGAAEIRDYLEEVTKVARERRGQGSIAKSRRREQLVNELGGVAAFSAFRDAYENSQLADIVLNNKELNKIEQKGSLLIRRYNPIYMEPASKTGRAHLYAPCKQLGNLKIDTLWFNVLVIWFACLLLYLALYFDLLRKGLGLFENVKLRKEES
jgi:hypothetical protein